MVIAQILVSIAPRWDIASFDIPTWYNIGCKHGFSCINIRQVPWEVLKTEAEGRGFQYLPRDLANVNALKNHVQSLLLHKKLKTFCFILRYILHYFVSPFHWCLANAISTDYARSRALQYTSRDWRQQICGPGTNILKVA